MCLQNWVSYDKWETVNLQKQTNKKTNLYFLKIKMFLKDKSDVAGYIVVY